MKNYHVYEYQPEQPARHISSHDTRQAVYRAAARQSRLVGDRQVYAERHRRDRAGRLEVMTLAIYERGVRVV